VRIHANLNEHAKLYDPLKEQIIDNIHPVIAGGLKALAASRVAGGHSQHRCITKSLEIYRHNLTLSHKDLLLVTLTNLLFALSV